MTKRKTTDDPLAKAAENEKCVKCGAQATTWKTGWTFTVKHPDRYLVWLCGECFAVEDAAYDQWLTNNASPDLN